MTKTEFAGVISWITAAIGKQIAEGVGERADLERKARMNVYYEMLGDLPVDVLSIAAKRVVVAHPWATFPSIAELREMAAVSSQGEVQMISAGEAWGMALKAAKKINPDLRGPYVARDRQGKIRTFNSQAEFACDGMPPIVFEAMRAFGITELANANPEFAQREFVKIFDSLAKRDERCRLLPASVAKALDNIAEKKALPSPVAAAVKQIGVQK